MTEAEQEEIFARVLESGRAPGQFGATVGLAFDKLDRTGAEGHFVATRELCNPFGIVHGGVYYTLMDQLAGMAVCVTGRAGVTLDSNVSYLRAARLGDLVRCRVESVHVGKTVAVYEGKCYGGDGTLLCTGTFHLFLNKPLEELAK